MVNSGYAEGRERIRRGQSQPANRCSPHWEESANHRTRQENTEQVKVSKDEEGETAGMKRNEMEDAMKTGDGEIGPSW